LTSHPNTNYHSKLRQTYRELSKTIRSNNACEKLITEPFKEISYNYYVMEIKSYDDKNTLKKSLIDSIKNTKKKVTTEVDYNQINKVILPPIKEEKITSKENLPKNRNELFEKKKNSNLEQLKKLTSIKPSRRGDTPNIFSGRKKI
jgi:hypothetical protein